MFEVIGCNEAIQKAFIVRLCFYITKKIEVLFFEIKG